jgi:DNA polymerase III subunit gamma/tau
VLRGDAAGALDRMDSLHQGGADPLMVLQDLLDLAHFLTRLKLAPEAGAGDPLEAGERERARPLAEALSMPVLARAWQMLLKGLEEVQSAPSPAQAAAMVLVRLAYVADLPVPADLVRALGAGEQASAASPQPPPVRASAPPPPTARRIEAAVAAASVPIAVAPTAPAQPQPPPTAELDGMPQSFAEVVALFDRRREALLRSHLWSHVHLVTFEPGRIEFRPQDGAPRDLANRLGQLLSEWTGARWIVAVSQAAGAPTLAEDEAQRASTLRNEVAAHPLVQAVLETFPGATIAAVRERFAASEAGAEEAEGEAAAGDGEDDGASAGEDDS